MKNLFVITIKVLFVFILITGCTKDITNDFEQLNEISGFVKFGSSSTQNEYGLACSISSVETSIISLSDFTINYTITNKSSVDFEERVYISLDMIQDKPSFPLGTYLGDYYSLLWWERTSWGRTTKLFELQKNSENTQAVNIADIGWISTFSSAIQPGSGNFYDLFSTGSFKFQLSIMVDDKEDYSTETPTIIYSNVLDLVIE